MTYFDMSMASTLFLFQSTHTVLKAERLLLHAGIACKVIPVPKQISSECGICLVASPEHAAQIRPLLYSAHIAFEEQAYRG